MSATITLQINGLPDEWQGDEVCDTIIDDLEDAGIAAEAAFKEIMKRKGYSDSVYALSKVEA